MGSLSCHLHVARLPSPRTSHGFTALLSSSRIGNEAQKALFLHAAATWPASSLTGCTPSVSLTNSQSLQCLSLNQVHSNTKSSLGHNIRTILSSSRAAKNTLDFCPRSPLPFLLADDISTHVQPQRSTSISPLSLSQCKVRSSSTAHSHKSCGCSCSLSLPPTLAATALAISSISTSNTSICISNPNSRLSLLSAYPTVPIPPHSDSTLKTFLLTQTLLLCPASNPRGFNLPNSNLDLGTPRS